ncbi:MAG: MBOAT family protein, partial [Firmicutes bacterium]|nr:MBOAT family protein [Bacillota bacterium]
MLFSSLIFLVVFLPCVLFIYYALLRKHRHLQNCFLLIASLGFYAWGEPWFVLVMFLSICCNYGFGLVVDKYRHDRPKARAVITLSLIFNLGIIFIFKYLMFTLENINALTGADIAIPEIALPIGISFFTFQAISYVIDVYREKGEVQRNLLNVGLYISFFPQLIAGPII